jgi:type VI secretion system secreted protein VgrG
VPRAWRSKLVRQQRCFLDSNIMQVAVSKLKAVGMEGDDVVENTLSTYPEREFIVQYHEDDEQFIGRLTEHAGVAFYIDNDLDKDRFVFVDHNDGFLEHAGEALTMAERPDEPHRLSSLTSRHAMSQGLVVVYDYNYRTPDVLLKAVKRVPSGHGGGLLEYPSHVKTPEDAASLATIRGEETAVHQKLFEGRSNILELRAGLRIAFAGNEHMPATNLLITSVEHSAEPEGGVDEVIYRNRFKAVHADLPFRPARVTPRPSISGIITAIIQGVDGEQGQRAMIDKHGRYTVEFHFDKALGGLTDKASHEVRMAQSCAGCSEGMHFPLKPGVEVCVAFIDGDPDRPIIVGALPNHTQPSVVTATNSVENKIATDTGITIKFGLTQSTK